MQQEPSRRHFLIGLAETERICRAVRELAGDEGERAVVGTATIRAVMAAHREAAGERPGRKAFRFLAPAGAEQLMAAAAIRVRGDAARPLSRPSLAAAPRQR
jgi:hypothetical protein